MTIAKGASSFGGMGVVVQVVLRRLTFSVGDTTPRFTVTLSIIFSVVLYSL